MLQTVHLLFFAYLIGAIPFSWIIARLYKVDLTQVGSGNIGATNVLRSLGKVPGGLALGLDFLKGYFPVYLALYLKSSPELVILTCLLAVLGHTFSIFMGFKGGKGVATGLGTLLAFAPDVFLIMAVYAIVVIALTRYVSLASTSGALLTAILLFMFHKPLPYSIGVSLAAIYIIFKHWPNLKRLLAGTESKIKL